MFFLIIITGENIFECSVQGFAGDTISVSLPKKLEDRTLAFDRAYVRVVRIASSLLFSCCYFPPPSGVQLKPGGPLLSPPPLFPQDH